MIEIDHTKNIVEIKNISFRYDEEEVLKDINFNIHKGDYLGVVGANGSGKTTLIKIIVGLLSPQKGSVKLFSSKIGYVSQKATNFDANFPATVNEVVMMGRNKNKKSAENSLRQVGMWDYRNRLIGELSGGQQQRVFIARALAGEPEIIFLDEPTTGIDKNSQNEFYSLLKKLNEELNLTLVLVTHDIEKILNEAMHIICINQTLTCYSTPTEFIKDHQALKMIGSNLKIIEHLH